MQTIVIWQPLCIRFAGLLKNKSHPLLRYIIYVICFDVDIFLHSIIKSTFVFYCNCTCTIYDVLVSWISIIIIFSTKDHVPVVRKIRNPDMFTREPMCLDYRGSTVHVHANGDVFKTNCRQQKIQISDVTITLNQPYHVHKLQLLEQNNTASVKIWCITRNPNYLNLFLTRPSSILVIEAIQNPSSPASHIWFSQS